MKIQRRWRGLSFGTAIESIADLRGRMEVYWEPRDLWIGAYIGDGGTVYLCLLPMVVVRFSRGRSA